MDVIEATPSVASCEAEGRGGARRGRRHLSLRGPRRVYCFDLGSRRRGRCRAEEFFGDVRAFLPEYGAEEVKAIGDALMVRVADPERAVRLGLLIVNDIGGGHGFPTVRVGMHTGPAVERHGDWFGATVNLAARVSGAAGGGQVLLTAATAERVRRRAGAGDLIFHPRGRRELRNIPEPVELFEASCDVSRSAEGLPIDPMSDGGGSRALRR